MPPLQFLCSKIPLLSRLPSLLSPLPSLPTCSLTDTAEDDEGSRLQRRVVAEGEALGQILPHVQPVAVGDVAHARPHELQQRVRHRLQRAQRQRLTVRRRERGTVRNPAQTGGGQVLNIEEYRRMTRIRFLKTVKVN